MAEPIVAFQSIEEPQILQPSPNQMTKPEVRQKPSLLPETTHSEIKLSELTIGIGPFVIEPAVTRKIGLSAMSQLSLEATQFFSPQWAQEKGLFMKLCPSIESLDSEVKQLAEQLCKYNPEALQKLKETFWKDTDDWSELLSERAAISGRLVLSDVTKTQLKKYK